MRAFKADLRQVISKHCIGAIEQLPRSRQILGKLPPHADFLSPLAREKKGYFTQRWISQLDSYRLTLRKMVKNWNVEQLAISFCYLTES